VSFFGPPKGRGTDAGEKGEEPSPVSEPKGKKSNSYSHYTRQASLTDRPGGDPRKGCIGGGQEQEVRKKRSMTKKGGEPRESSHSAI